MITLTAESKCYGNNGQYIARITGRSAKFTFERQFTGSKADRTTHAYIDEPGLYEITDIDRKGRKDHSFAVIIARPADCPPLTDKADDELMRMYVSQADAAAIAKRIEDGEDLSTIIEPQKTSAESYDCRIRSKGEAKKASKAMTLQTVIDACWQQMSNLPEKEAKAVLKALKERVSPPKPSAPATDEAQIDLEGQRQNEEEMGEL